MVPQKNFGKKFVGYNFELCKKNDFIMSSIFYCLCVILVTLSLSGCRQKVKYISPEKSIKYGSLTLLWSEMPSATSYNVYLSESPGVTKLSGYKIANVTNPFRINQLEPGKTYHFVITVINESGESKESKELSYYSVADKIGLVYWKKLFDKSMQDQNHVTGQKEKEIQVAPDRSREETESADPGNEALSDRISDDKIASFDWDKDYLKLPKESMVENVDIQEKITENSTSATIPVENSTDNSVLELEDKRLKDAQKLVTSHFHIFFEQNSNELSPQAIEKLDHIYKILANNTDATLKLNGYSDSKGSPSINQMVSEVRASSVKSYLSGKGIKSSRMMAFGHGAKNFLVSNNSAEGRRLNRRVEIELIMP